MTIYIEDCLLENFVVTFLIIKCVSAYFKLNVKKCRLIISCILGALIATFYPMLLINNFLLIVLKLCVGILITLVAFDSKNFLAKYLAFMFFTALYGGLNILVYYLWYGTINIQENFPTYVLLLLLLIIYYFVISILKFAKKRFTISNFIYSVKIFNNETTILTNAFLDSGNTLLDQDSTPIFIINPKLFNKLYKDISFSDLLTKNYKNLKEPHYVKSQFASGGGKILVFSVDIIQIIENNQVKTEIKNAKLGVSYSKFSKNFNCDMLLNICAFA